MSAATQPLGISWDSLILTARNTLARVLAPGNTDSYRRGYEPESHLDLFTNTISALSRVLARIERDYPEGKATLLTSDREFAGCVAAIDDYWSGPVAIAQTGSEGTNGGATSIGLDASLIRAFNFVKPGLVFVSHVVRTTGQVLSSRTLEYFREANPGVVIIVDGSQAIGNVVISHELLRHVDFYVGSGHKWLGGLPSSGFAWRREPGRWEVADPGQSLSYPGYLGGTGNAAAWKSLISSVRDMIGDRPLSRLHQIQEYNRDLAGLFCSLVDKARVGQVVTPRPRGRSPSGLVTIGLAEQAGRRLADALKAGGYEATMLGYEPVRWRESTTDRFVIEFDSGWPQIADVDKFTPARPSRARHEYRFCFHYWHTQSDVEDLARLVSNAGKTQRRRTRIAREAVA